jgi:hypothetical protein
VSDSWHYQLLSHSQSQLYGKHAWDMGHTIDFQNGKVIDSGNYIGHENIRILAYCYNKKILTIILSLLQYDWFKNDAITTYADASKAQNSAITAIK